MLIHRTTLVTRVDHFRGFPRRLIIEAPGIVVPAIENALDPDFFPEGEHTLVMTTMATRRDGWGKRVKWFWLEGTEMGIHPANFASDLKGCIGAGLSMSVNGVVKSREAQARLFRAFGGYADGRRVRCVVVGLP